MIDTALVQLSIIAFGRKLFPNLSEGQVETETVYGRARKKISRASDRAAFMLIKGVFGFIIFYAIYEGAIRLQMPAIGGLWKSDVLILLALAGAAAVGDIAGMIIGAGIAPKGAQFPRGKTKIIRWVSSQFITAIISGLGLLLLLADTMFGAETLGAVFLAWMLIFIIREVMFAWLDKALG